MTVSLRYGLTGKAREHSLFRMEYGRKWFLNLLIFFSAGLAVIAAFNFWMDPFMTFSHSHAYNNRQSGLADMLAKAYHLHTHQGKYTSAFLGGASVALLNSHDSFNYGIQGFAFGDTFTALDFLHKTNPELRKIYLGMDSAQYFLPTTSRFDSSDSFTFEVASPFYKYKKLLIYDTLKFSMVNLLNNFFPVEGYYYDREFRPGVDPQVYVDPPHYFIFGEKLNEYYQPNLKKLKKRNEPGLVVYTNPIAESRLRTLHKFRENEYRDWLRLLVNTFGKVEHFAYLNEVTLDSSGNFFTDVRFYPRVGELIYRRLHGDPDPSLKDFGVTLTPENIEQELEREERLLGGAVAK